MRSINCPPPFSRLALGGNALLGKGAALLDRFGAVGLHLVHPLNCRTQLQNHGVVVGGLSGDGVGQALPGGVYCFGMVDHWVLSWREVRVVSPSQFDPSMSANTSALITDPTATPLAGADLIAMVKELGNVSKSEQVRAAGYVSTQKNGAERLNFTAFYEALLAANGIGVGADCSPPGKRGPKPKGKTRVQHNGNLMVGKAYTAQLGLRPGDEFVIKLGRKEIRLVPVGAADSEG